MTASVHPDKNAFPLPRGSREAARDTLYRTIMEHVSHRRSSREPDKSVGETYREAPSPKALVVCLNWSKTAPTQLGPGAVSGSHTDLGNLGCRGLSAEQCGRNTLGRCHERALCRSRGHECVLVDINGRNALKLNQAWAQRYGP
jgi:hypothetical protein